MFNYVSLNLNPAVKKKIIIINRYYICNFFSNRYFCNKNIFHCTSVKTNRFLVIIFLYFKANKGFIDKIRFLGKITKHHL